MPKLAPDTPDYLVGDTFIRDYDLGMIKRLEGFVGANGEQFFAKIQGVPAPSFPDDYPDTTLRRAVMPGVPITLAGPSDAISHWVNPSIVVRRQDPAVAMDRWHAGSRKKYVRPADGATAVTTVLGGGIDKKTGKLVSYTATGYSAYESKPQPWPYDISYTIMARAEGNRAETVSQNLFRFIGKRFPPRDNLDVTDSQGSTDGYTMFVDGPVSLSESMDLAHRVRGWSWSVRILGLLDNDDAIVEKAVTKKPNVKPAQQK